MSDLGELVAGTEYQELPAQQQVRPAYKVRKLEGTVPRTIYTRDKKTGKLVKTTVDQPAGFLVTFMNGSSLRAATVKDLIQMGVKSVVPLINADGDVVATTEL